MACKRTYPPLRNKFATIFPTHIFPFFPKSIHVKMFARAQVVIYEFDSLVNNVHRGAVRSLPVSDAKENTRFAKFCVLELVRV